MWKIVTGIAVAALAIFFVLQHDSDEPGKPPGASTGVQPSAAASQNAGADNAAPPRFTNYENEANRPRRVTKSTTGTIVVLPGGRRIPPR